MTKAKLFTLPLIKKEQIAKGTYSFYFDRSQVDFIFFPGQYVRMTLPHQNPDDRGTSRYFTIASSPLAKEIMITTKLLKSSFKEALLQLSPGQAVQFFGPMGWFLLPKDDKQEKVFISGGIGITPFHSLLQTLKDKKLDTPITLIAAFSAPQDAIFYEKLTAIAKKNPQIGVVYAFSRISELVLKKYVSDLQQPVYYVVGSEAMVAATKELLLALGIAEEKIQTEDFTGY